jgi:hypothetical protein
MHANYRLTLVIAASLYPATPAFAQSDLPGKEAIDVIWLAMASALVFFMQAGFALLESGMSRSKNCINVVMKNYTDVCVGSLFFWQVGFGLMFGANPSGWFGTSGFALHHGKSWDYSFLLFQTMFAATAATIASGAMAERTRFPAYLFAAAVITAFIYPVFGSWAWGVIFPATVGWRNWASWILPVPLWCTRWEAGAHWPGLWYSAPDLAASTREDAPAPFLDITSILLPSGASFCGLDGSVLMGARPSGPTSTSA